MIHSHRTLSKAALIAALIGLFAATAAQANPGEALEQAVTRLGKLNGAALACKQGALSARARETLIELAPKERSIGELFEQATNETFLSSGASGEECPDARTLASQIDLAREELRRAAGAKP